MARDALARFGLTAVYVEAGEPIASEVMANHWVVQITSTQGDTRLVEADAAESIAAALYAMGEREEASMVESAAQSVRGHNRPPSAWSLGP